MSANIHPTAVISPEAKLGSGISVGPYSIIEGNVEIGDNTVIDSNVRIASNTVIGKNCRIFHGAVIGEVPQDLSFRSDIFTGTKIGDNVTLREYVTIHRATKENTFTEVGDNALLMAFVHAGHDCKLGNNVIIANNTALAGHVTVGDRSVVSAYILVHQFCRIGKFVMIGGGARIRQDVPHYCIVSDESTVYGVNTVGLRRAGFDEKRRFNIKKAVKTYFFRHLNSRQAVAQLNEEYPDDQDIAEFIDFVNSSKRGILQGKTELNAITAESSKEE